MRLRPYRRFSRKDRWGSRVYGAAGAALDPAFFPALEILPTEPIYHILPMFWVYAFLDFFTSIIKSLESQSQKSGALSTKLRTAREGLS